MSSLDVHPTVESYRHREPRAYSRVLDGGWLRQLCLEAGADDVGFVNLDRPEVADQRAEIRSLFPWTRYLVSFVCRTNQEPIRSPARSVANLEFHQTGDRVNEVARRIVTALAAKGIRAANPAMGFPMEMSRFPGKSWVISHKPVAEAAALGRQGIHRSVIHPRFGSFILLGTIMIEAEVTEEGSLLDFNPCLECKLCVAACPVGAIRADGHFDFSACYTHNYREFMGGFTDWVEGIAESRDRRQYRNRFSDSETASMWQSLGFGPNYKAAYCIAVCPAGEDVIGPFLDDRKAFLREVVNPLQEKPEILYVVPGSDAEAYAMKRFPHKRTRRVGNGLRPDSIRSFLLRLPDLFQRHRSDGLAATYHFTFTGEEPIMATVVIRDKTIRVDEGHNGNPDLMVRADSRTWLGFLRKEKSLLWALIRRKIVLRGSPRLLLRFGRCFPS
jgi:Fe-S-cluster-containing hydrogenase component 2